MAGPINVSFTKAAAASLPNGGGAVRAFHKVDACDGVRLVPVTLAGVGDLLGVRGVKGPAPLICNVLVEVEIHDRLQWR